MNSYTQQIESHAYNTTGRYVCQCSPNFERQQKSNRKILYKKTRSTEKDNEQPSLVPVDKQLMPELLSVTIVVVYTKAETLLHFDSDCNSATRKYLPEQGLLKASRSHR